MPKNVKEERLRWIKPIAEGEVRLCDVVRVCPHSQRSLERWLKSYREQGETGLVPKKEQQSGKCLIASMSKQSS